MLTRHQVFFYSPLRWGLLGWASLKSCDGLLLLTLETVLGMMTSKKKKKSAALASQVFIKKDWIHSVDHAYEWI